jgi:hypothetical protein
MQNKFYGAIFALISASAAFVIEQFIPLPRPDHTCFRTAPQPDALAGAPGAVTTSSRRA